MAKSNPSKDIKELMKTLEKAKEELLDTIQDVGDEAANLIRKRTRLGYGVAEKGASKHKLTALNEKYARRRKHLINTSLTTPKRSNLTQTGEMLDSLTAVKKSDDTVEITFSSEEAMDKATWNTDKGRPFNNLSRSEIRQLKQSIQTKLDKILKKIT